MCGTCGCGNDDHVHIMKPGDAHHHHHTHHQQTIDLEADILSQNKLLAERNRGFFEAKKITTLNLVSSPGSGKTTLLEKTVKNLNSDRNIYVIEGDQQTLNDARRIEEAGAPAIQINTGSGCHLDAAMINNAVKKLSISDNALLIIENVGNLVCPSLFDLGEKQRVVIISVTEGEDKPIKYPNIFETSDLCIINKIDLLPYVDFDVEKMKDYAKKVNPNINFFELSAKTGEGLNNWVQFLQDLQ